MGRAEFIVIKGGDCAGGNCKNTTEHHHSISVSELNTWLQNNIPSNAVITGVSYQVGECVFKRNNIISVAKINMGLYYGSGGTDGDRLGFYSKLEAPDGTTPVRDKTFTIDINKYFNTTYPFNMSTSKSKLTLCFTTENIFNTTITCNDVKIIIDYSTTTWLNLGKNGEYTDSLYVLDSNGNNIGKNVALENGNTYTICARSFDGRKIIRYKQYDDDSGTLVSQLDGSDLSMFLSEDNSVFNMSFTVNTSMVNKSSSVIITFDKVVYVSYDNCFNHYKWFHEGLREDFIANVTPTSHTLMQPPEDKLDGGYRTTPLFKVKAGLYLLSFESSLDIADLPICFEYSLFDNGKNYISTSDIVYPTSNQVQINVASDGYIEFWIANTVWRSTATYSNFVMYPYDPQDNKYDYMLTSVSESKRIQTGKWNMPTPIRDGYDFVGWNTEPDGSGVTYTSDMPFPTEDLVLYSQWEQISNTYVGKWLADVYVGNRLADVYVGTRRV